MAEDSANAAMTVEHRPAGNLSIPTRFAPWPAKKFVFKKTKTTQRALKGPHILNALKADPLVSRATVLGFGSV